MRQDVVLFFWDNAREQRDQSKRKRYQSELSHLIGCVAQNGDGSSVGLCVNLWVEDELGLQRSKGDDNDSRDSVGPKRVDNCCLEVSTQSKYFLA